jgi:hypothetical protein
VAGWCSLSASPRYSPEIESVLQVAATLDAIYEC